METWINSTEIHRGPVFSVLSGTARRDDGTRVKREVIHHQGSVAVVAISSDRVLLVSQDRIAAGSRIWEIPAGRIEKHETPEQAAKRELEEETGYTGELQPGSTYYASVGYSDEVVHVFFALDVKRISPNKPQANPDPGEISEFRWISLAQVAKDLREYKFDDSKTMIGLREALSLLNLSDQMIDDNRLYALYSEENHKYNTLIWQFPVAIVGLNVLAVPTVGQNTFLMVVLWFINNVLLLCVAKHVYHQRCFTKALEAIAVRFRTMHPYVPVVEFPREGLLQLTKVPVTLLLISSLFLLNQVLYAVVLWKRY